MAEAELELTETLDEIELAKFRRMATDALSGHFPIHIYGDRDHTEVLARALERCVDALADDNAEEVVETAKGRLEDMSIELEAAESKLKRIREILLGVEEVKPA